MCNFSDHRDDVDDFGQSSNDNGSDDTNSGISKSLLREIYLLGISRFSYHYSPHLSRPCTPVLYVRGSKSRTTKSYSPFHPPRHGNTPRRTGMMLKARVKSSPGRRSERRACGERVAGDAATGDGLPRHRLGRDQSSAVYFLIRGAGVRVFFTRDVLRRKERRRR